MARILVTGGAGFIGSHLVRRLLEEDWTVTVVDNFDPYYDPVRKRENVEPYRSHSNFQLVEGSITDEHVLKDLPGGYDTVVHLAAKCGVRPSLDDPYAYYRINVVGTQMLLDRAVEWDVDQFIFGSSSSVYGINQDVPWSEDADPKPVSPYATTKRAGELLGHVCSRNDDLPFLALRFFSVYGPRQRPDLAMHKFARKMLQGEPVPLYGDGSSFRDYTHVRDVVDGVMSAMDYEGEQYRIYNLGNGNPVQLDELVDALERALGISARRKYLSTQPGDVPRTLASIDRARKDLGYEPKIELDEGLAEFADWAEARHRDSSVHSA